MNKESYNRAVDKIKASDELKNKIMISTMSKEKIRNKININKVIAVVSIFMITISAVYFSTLSRRSMDNDIAGEFKIIENTNPNIQMCYISVLYLEGYSYEASSWNSYSVFGNLKDADELKGEKIGEVTLDLKGKIYRGTPPDFSSTYGVGTEVYEVEGVKKENAVLIVSGEIKHILYRTRKALASENEPIGLTVEEVINMISNAPIINSVELRDEVDSSWMRTSYDNRLLDLLNTEIQDLNILSYNGIERVKGNRIPINLMFQDGAVLHMQVYPQTNIAYIFGGYINISNELVSRLEELYRLGNEYPKITEIISYDPSKLGYFQLDNNVSGNTIISPEPSWSGGALYEMLSYYSVDKSPNLEGRLVATIKLGESEVNSREFKIYEGTDKNLLFKVDNEIYNIVKGRLTYKDLLMYQQDYTSN